MIIEKEDANPLPGFPTFTAEEVHLQLDGLGDKMIAVTCPRTGCRSEFWVKPVWLDRKPAKGGKKKWRTYPTRACPYCFRASCLPKEIK